MHELDYANAVARIRYNEMKLLKTEDSEQLVISSDYASALKKLGELGYDAAQGNLKSMLDGELKKAWALLLEIAPDKAELQVFSVVNAFHNLKSALKHRISGTSGGPYYLEPSCVEVSLIDKAVNTNNFLLLPEYMQDAADKAYKAMTQNDDGQLGEAVLDKRALEMYLEYAKYTKCPEVIELANLKCACSDLKIAYRSALTGKKREFLDASLCPCEGLDTEKLAAAATLGTDELSGYINDTPYKEAGKLLVTDSVAFEKWCDDRIIKIVSSAKYKAFGFAPLAAYWIAKDTEIKNIRIIMSSVQNGLSPEDIRERTRMLYV